MDIDWVNVVKTLAESIVYSVIGIVMFAASFLIIKLVTPFSLRKEIEEDQNTALAILIGSVILGLSIIIAAVLMPLAFGALVGGMATLFTSSNIITSSLLRDNGIAGYNVLSFLPMGIPLIITAIAYMAFLGRRWLPEATPTERLMGETSSELVNIYRLEERLIRARLFPSSELVGKTLEESCLRECMNINVVAIERSGRIHIPPAPEFIFQTGDLLVLEGRPEDVTSHNLSSDMEILSIGDVAERTLADPETAVVEAVLAPRSSLIETTLRESHFREKYRVNVLAIWRAGRPIRTRFSDLPLQIGDALLLQGSASQIPVLSAERDLIVLGGDMQVRKLNRSKALPAIAIMIGTLVFAAMRPDYIGEIMLGGALLMVLSGVLSMDRAYRAIDWKTIFLIAGMLPLGLAISKTGAAANLADFTIGLLGAYGPLALLAGLIILSILLVQVINGTVVVAIMVPIAIQTAQKLGADPRSFAMGIALAASFAFITPLGHAVNILVMGSAGYRFSDFRRVGLPLTIILLILILALLPLIWPLF